MSNGSDSGLRDLFDCFEGHYRKIQEEKAKTLNKLEDEIMKLTTENAKLQKRLWLAVSDVNNLRKLGGWGCKYCMYEDEFSRAICIGCDYNDGNNWAWHGFKERSDENG